MQRFGGAATHMEQSFNREVLDRLTYLAGSREAAEEMACVPALKPFDSRVTDFLDGLSRTLMREPRSRTYPDVATFAFWIRRGSTENLRKHHEKADRNIRLGRGMAFHIAPSNVPVNFAYSLAAGLLTGNRNMVRIPTKDFPQTDIICQAVNRTLEEYGEMKPYIVLVRYGRNKEINDVLSAMADIRIVWGGDKTIAELRKSQLPPRSTEVTFADRYSLAVIDGDVYLDMEDKEKTAVDFYNDTYLTDQNACTSPRIVVWTGEKKTEAKEMFWRKLHQVVKEKYPFQGIQAVNKLTSSCLAAVRMPGVKTEPHEDNLIIRVAVEKARADLMELKDNSGYFFEYDCENLLEIRPLCDDKRCQTISYIGKKEMLLPLLRSGIKGVDRIVPVGKTMDFGLLWDGYDLAAQLTRVISC